MDFVLETRQQESAVQVLFAGDTGEPSPYSKTRHDMAPRDRILNEET